MSNSERPLAPAIPPGADTPVYLTADGVPYQEGMELWIPRLGLHAGLGLSLTYSHHLETSMFNGVLKRPDRGMPLDLVSNAYSSKKAMKEQLIDRLKALQVRAGKAISDLENLE